MQHNRRRAAPSKNFSHSFSREVNKRCKTFMIVKTTKKFHPKKIFRSLYKFTLFFFLDPKTGRFDCSSPREKMKRSLTTEHNTMTKVTKVMTEIGIWQNIPDDLWLTILKNLSFTEKRRMKNVCKAWSRNTPTASATELIEFWRGMEVAWNGTSRPPLRPMKCDEERPNHIVYSFPRGKEIRIILYAALPDSKHCKLKEWSCRHCGMKKRRRHPTWIDCCSMESGAMDAEREQVIVQLRGQAQPLSRVFGCDCLHSWCEETSEFKLSDFFIPNVRSFSTENPKRWYLSLCAQVLTHPDVFLLTHSDACLEFVS
jgi:hypothetical protein